MHRIISVEKHTCISVAVYFKPNVILKSWICGRCNHTFFNKAKTQDMKS